MLILLLLLLLLFQKWGIIILYCFSKNPLFVLLNNVVRGLLQYLVERITEDDRINVCILQLFVNYGRTPFSGSLQMLMF